MKTIAELKRAIKVGGKLSSTYHLSFAGRDENGKAIYKDEYKGIREISLVMSTQFALKTFYTKDGKYRDSFMPWPKSKEVLFNDDGSFTILEEMDGKMIPVITYHFQPDTASCVEFSPKQTINA